MNKKKKGVGRRFVLLLIVYAMLVGVIVAGLADMFPKGFSELWVKLLVAGVAVGLFLMLFLYVEHLNDKKGR